MTDGCVNRSAVGHFVAFAALRRHGVLLRPSMYGAFKWAGSFVQDLTPPPDFFASAPSVVGTRNQGCCHGGAKPAANKNSAMSLWPFSMAKRKGVAPNRLALSLEAPASTK